jgi:outer membrane protein TolC
LSAEAKLYEAESKEINFAADRQRAQVQIVGALGLLSKALNINVEQLDG